MRKEEIINRLQIIFRDIFDDEDIILADDTNSDQIEDWDSLAQIRLVVAIEKNFGIKFAFGELTHLKNVGGMIECIQNKLSLS